MSSRSWISLVERKLLSLLLLVSCSSKFFLSKAVERANFIKMKSSYEHVLKWKPSVVLQVWMHQLPFPREQRARWQSAGHQHSQQLLLGSWELSGARWSCRKPSRCQVQRTIESKGKRHTEEMSTPKKQSTRLCFRALSPFLFLDVPMVELHGRNLCGIRMYPLMNAKNFTNTVSFHRPTELWKEEN